MVAQIKVMRGLIHARPFGPVVTFRVGGIFVEVLNAVASHVVPLRPRDVHAMMCAVRPFRTSEGLRGASSVDLGALEDILLTPSFPAEQHSEFDEIELHPVFA
jgi:acetate---CoA ligase (ADP-forming)